MLVDGAPRACPRACTVLLFALSSGCLLEDERCGPNMEMREGLCMCVEGATYTSNQCLIVDAGGPQPDAGPGAACSASTACTGAEAPHCQIGSTGAGYCTTTGCTSSSSCPTSFVCVTSSSPSYCRRPYTGQGQACDSDSNCAQFDANFCVVVAHKCAVPDCTATSCDPGYACLAPGGGFRPICVSEGMLQ